MQQVAVQRKPDVVKAAQLKLLMGEELDHDLFNAVIDSTPKADLVDVVAKISKKEGGDYDWPYWNTAYDRPMNFANIVGCWLKHRRLDDECKQVLVRNGLSERIPDLCEELTDITDMEKVFKYQSPHHVALAVNKNLPVSLMMRLMAARYVGAKRVLCARKDLPPVVALEAYNQRDEYAGWILRKCERKDTLSALVDRLIEKEHSSLEFLRSLYDNDGASDAVKLRYGRYCLAHPKVGRWSHWELPEMVRIVNRGMDVRVVIKPEKLNREEGPPRGLVVRNGFSG